TVARRSVRLPDDHAVVRMIAVEFRPSVRVRIVQFDLLSLKLFIAVVEEQSIARAAAREHIAASAVSKRIAELERGLKVALLQRNNRGIVTTAAGNALLRHARNVVRDMAQLEGELVEYSEGLKGQIRLFANSTAILRFLPQQLVSFLSHHPRVQ